MSRTIRRMVALAAVFTVATLGFGVVFASSGGAESPPPPVVTPPTFTDGDVTQVSPTSGPPGTVITVGPACPAGYVQVILWGAESSVEFELFATGNHFTVPADALPGVYDIESACVGYSNVIENALTKFTVTSGVPAKFTG